MTPSVISTRGSRRPGSIRSIDGLGLEIDEAQGISSQVGSLMGWKRLQCSQRFLLINFRYCDGVSKCPHGGEDLTDFLDLIGPQAVARLAQQGCQPRMLRMILE